MNPRSGQIFALAFAVLLLDQAIANVDAILFYPSLNIAITLARCVTKASNGFRASEVENKPMRMAWLHSGRFGVPKVGGLSVNRVFGGAVLCVRSSLST